MVSNIDIRALSIRSVVACNGCQVMLVDDPVNGRIVCVAGCVLNRSRPVLMCRNVSIDNLASQRIVCSGIRRICVNCSRGYIRGRNGTRDAYNIISNINVITTDIFRDIRSIDSRSVNGRNFSVFCSFECRKRSVVNTDNRSSLAIFYEI